MEAAKWDIEGPKPDINELEAMMVELNHGIIHAHQSGEEEPPVITLDARAARELVKAAVMSYSVWRSPAVKPKFMEKAAVTFMADGKGQVDFATWNGGMWVLCDGVPLVAGIMGYVPISELVRRLAVETGQI